jgi:4-alpha-glucanotransferase
LSLQDWLSIDEKIRLADPDKERINIPANPRHYWRYRMHLNIEDLMKNKEFNEMVTTLIDQAAVS